MELDVNGGSGDNTDMRFPPKTEGDRIVIGEYYIIDPGKRTLVYVQDADVCYVN